jgi:hypothetical protein
MESVMVEMFQTSFGPVAPEVTTFFVMVAAIALVCLAASRVAVGSAERLRLGLLVSGVIAAWYGAALLIGKTGYFFAASDLTVPRIPFPIVLPVVAAAWTMTRSVRVSALIDAVPFSWLTAIQVYRALGAMFVGLWAANRLPGEFALPAGWGDIIVGLSAIPVALMAASGHRASPTTLRLWNLFGVADLVVAVATGFLTSPGPYQLLALDRPNLLISAYPLVMVPIFAVPLSFILHIAGFVKLRRMAATTCATSKHGHEGDRAYLIASPS